MYKGMTLYKIFMCGHWMVSTAILLEVDDDSNQMEAIVSTEAGLDVWPPFPPKRLEAQVLVGSAPTWDEAYQILVIDTWNMQYRFFTEFAPEKSPDRYALDTLHCEAFLRCTEPPKPAVLGIGRKCGNPYWVLAVTVPFATAVLIMICTTWKPRGTAQSVYGTLDVRSLYAYASLIASLSFTAMTSYYVNKMVSITWPPIATEMSPHEILGGKVSHTTMGTILYVLPTCYFLTCVSIVATLRFARVDFAWPDFHSGMFLQVIGILRALAYYILWVSTFRMDYLTVWGNRTFRLIIGILTDSIFGLQMAFQGPNLGMLATIILGLRWHTYMFLFWGDATGSAICVFTTFCFPISVFRLCFCVLCFFTPYSRDRTFLAAAEVLIAQAIRFGLRIDLYKRKIMYEGMSDTESVGLLVRVFFRCFSLIATGAICVLLMRYQRVLPSGLGKAKFVRLSYLLQMRRDGQMITRCQDAPDAAFGNPSKAFFLIVVSHRWIDRYTCDVATPEFPEGLRLVTMSQKLEHLFPQSWKACTMIKASVMQIMRLALGSALYTSHDVLIFLDFMALPQIGRLPDGSIIERTLEEKELFENVLPHMGALYTMYPVLVCPEVPDGVSPYSMSGWCFCELAQASLHGKVLDDGVDNGEECMLDTAGINIDDDREEFQRDLEAALTKKVFFFEGDRDTVRKIVKGTTIVRMLQDAVTQQDANKVQTFLMQLSAFDITDAINYAVDDSSLDTVLHIAMKLPSQKIVDLLIQFGADPDCLNFRGDRPRELFMIPRAWLPYSKLLPSWSQ